MSENAIVVREDAVIMPSVPDSKTIESVWRLAKIASASGMAKAKKPEDAFFIAMYGLELGIPPMTALRTIYSIQGGVPTCSGEALLSLMRKSPKVRIQVPNVGEITDSATITIERLDTGETQSFTYTKAMAQKAGLANKDNWKKHLHMMLFWRVISMGAKAMCSDIVGGLYTIEEIAPDSQVNEQGELVGEVIIESSPRKAPPTQPEEDAIEEGTKKTVTIAKRITKKDKPKLWFRTTETDGSLLIKSYSRQPFIEKLYCDENDWLVEDEPEEITFTANIVMGKYGWWEFDFATLPEFNPNFDSLGNATETEQPTLDGMPDAQDSSPPNHYTDEDIPM